MIKKFCTLFLWLIMMPVYAGQLEDALAKGKPVFLYMYAPNCGYCEQFAPRYQVIANKYSANYTFVKIDVSTYYGYKLLRQLKARYVPYVALIKPNSHYAVQVGVDCLMNNSCAEQTLANYIK